ncbi:MAG: hypothetical protein U0325_30720 [Polyangiales bacterium]
MIVEAAGIMEFVGSTSRDEPVRPDHKAPKGQRFRHDEPPVADRRKGTRGLLSIHSQGRFDAVPGMIGFGG